MIRYTLHELIGTGSMGAVYRATDPLTGETVALKRVRSTVETVATVTLAQEFRTLASLRHPNIISVLDYGFTDEAVPFFTMELLHQPQTILDVAADSTRQIDLLLDVLAALGYLHRQGVLHRDLKPANVLIAGEQTKVLDFGLAQTLKAQQPEEDVTGTFIYMAPEMYNKRDSIGPAADLYALGIIAYEMLVGRHLFDTSDMLAFIQATLNQPPDLTPLDAALAPVIGRLLAKQPADRFETAHDAITALCDAVDRPPPAESEAIRESFLQASSFVGREAEMNQLRAALAGAADHIGSVWLVAGESGVGKTRLLDELRIRALVEGAVVLRGQGVAESGRPHDLWTTVARQLALTPDLTDLEAGALRELIPDIETLLGRAVPPLPDLEGEAARQRLVSTLSGLLKRQPPPTVLLMEDLHWANLGLLTAVLEDDLPVLVIGSYRDDEAPDLPTQFPQARVLYLDRLSEADTRALSASMLGEASSEVVHFLHEQTEGNAFFIVEVVRTLAEEAGGLSDVGRVALPERIMAGGVQEVIRRRLERVPDAHRPLLELAAVAGRQIDLPLMRRLTDDQALNKWLITCTGLAVLAVEGGDWQFAHDKLREGLLADLTPEARPDLHRQIAEAIEAVYPESHAPALVAHWGAAGTLDKQAAYAGPASEQLLRTGEYAQVEAMVGNLLAALPDDHPQRWALLMHLADAHRSRSAYEEAQATFEQALVLAGDDLYRRAQVLVKLGGVAERLSAFDEAQPHLNEALRLFRLFGAQPGIAASLHNLGNIALARGDYASAKHTYQRVLAIRQELADTGGIASVMNTIGIAHLYLGEYDPARRAFEESLALQQQIGDRGGTARALHNLGIVNKRLGHLEEAESFYQQCLPIYRETGDRRGIAYALNSLGVIAESRGEYEEAHRYYKESLTIRQEIGSKQSVAIVLINLGIVARKAGAFGEAMANLNRALLLCQQIGDQQGIADCLQHLGVMATQRKSHPTAHEHLTEALALYREMGDQEAIIATLGFLAVVVARQGDHEQAQALIAEGMAAADDMGAEPPLMMLTAAATQVDVEAGRYSQAAERAAIVLTNPATPYEARDDVTALLPTLRNVLGTAAVDALLMR